MKAELLRISGESQEAMNQYEACILHAHQHNYLNVEALAYELYAKHLLALGFKVLASNSLSKAVEVYTKWGAMVKVDLLVSKYSNLVDSLQHKVVRTEPLNRQQPDLDMMIVVQALHMLSQGVEYHSLLERFVTLVVKSASAERGAVVLKGDGVKGSMLSYFGATRSQMQEEGVLETGEMKVAVFWDARTTNKPNVFHSPVLLTDYHQLPGEIIQAVANTKQNVLIQNISESDYNFKNASVPESASIVCLPIFHKGTDVVGVMYLEHSSSGVFNRDRLQMLELLCVQLGILLQNALLYESMQESMQMYAILLMPLFAKLIFFQ